MVRWVAGYGRSVVRHQSSSRSLSTSIPEKRKYWGKSMEEWAPISIVCGFVVIAGGLAARTGWQQIVHNPNVYVSKSKRDTIPELDDPSNALHRGSKYVDKSLLRKVAHIQDHSNPLISDPHSQGRNIYTRSRSADTLDSIKK